jgi:hypothetical protein
MKLSSTWKPVTRIFLGKEVVGRSATWPYSTRSVGSEEFVIATKIVDVEVTPLG